MTSPARNERRGWVYDPNWDYFVTESSALQTIALLEAVEREPDWASSVGLDRETVAWLIEHPTVGAYNGTKPHQPVMRDNEDDDEVIHDG